ncbi:oxidoreductase [Streptomyces sp. ISL-36]|uniref:PDR/VanB family oxidoreductase n=1 Tax=Streptomyces sp. ISL-36 TaxID=2819182 RepID=UPI001BECC3CC|nr:PDR/VanB family oxidoreductase [Streptomyces sp. ISL-36]MBT2440235.1 oxidoreductase [Streptomyces sp. ISL-36]
MTITSPQRTGVELDLTLARKEPLAEGVVRLSLAHPRGERLPAWTPGAHIDLVLGPDLVRQYSLCGDPGDSSLLQVAVLREPESRGGSRYVHDTLAEGDTVRVSGPRNHFQLVDSPRYLFIAGGIGITPVLPMIATAEQWGADWRLVYGGRSRATMAFAGHLTKDHPDRVALCPQDETGLLDLDGLLGSPAPGTVIYCCGPEPLLSAVERRCASWPEGTLHIERFTPKGREEDASSTPFKVELSRSGITVTVPPDKTVLQAVEEAGVQVLSSCQEGTCGTCETAVLDGVVDHRDSLLTPAEQARNDTMFVCVSRAACPRLVLDL